MSDHNRIRFEQLQLGTPVPVDVYDARGRLLLRCGNVVASEAQLKRLRRDGLFAEPPLAAPDSPATPAAGDGVAGDPCGGAAHAGPQTRARGPRVSVYADTIAAALKLEALLASPQANPAFVAEIETLAAALRKDCAADADAALAHIMFARDVRYPARQQINAAIVTAVLLQRTRTDCERAHGAVCATLTMNLTIQPLQEVLYHRPTMTPEQRAAIASHPAAARKLLEDLGVRNESWLTLVEQHHEALDGSGYPKHLAGSAILREALVIGLADRYCAAVTERAYRDAVAPNVAIGFMQTKSRSAPEQVLIAELVRWIGMYPPGTVVQLANRDIAIVTRRLHDPLHPVVHAVSRADLNAFKVPHKRLTGKHPRFFIDRVLPRTIIDFSVDTDILWPRTLVDTSEAAPFSGYSGAVDAATQLA